MEMVALQQSIIKWENNVQLCKEGSAKAHTCPLCMLFYNFENYAEEDCCIGCPIEKAKNRYCEDTPYDDVIFCSEVAN